MARATIDRAPALQFAGVRLAVADLAAGKAVIVVDDADRENEGDLLFAGEHASAELVAFTIRWSSGVVCVPMEAADLDRLHLPPMTAQSTEPKGTAYAVSVDSGTGVSTGISAADRARTIRQLADPGTGAADFTRPGHVFPLRAVAGGVLARPGHTEAAIDLVRMAGLRPVGAICELVNDDGTMMRLPELVEFGERHGIRLCTIADLVAYRRQYETQVLRVADARIPTRHGDFRAVGYRSVLDGREHVALVLGDVGAGGEVLARVHSECLTGDVFGSLRCDCGPQLDEALAAVAAAGLGVVVYLRGHEGRGIGLLQKLQAYELQDGGADTVDANLNLGLPADARDYATGAQILADLGVASVRLLTNNPAKRAGLERYGVTVADQAPMPVLANPENLRYLRTKRDRMGHQVPGLPEVAVSSLAPEVVPS
jgi:3,4-dihydroxy 2-butanone 4-phosphate synthase / GTP cyclohydrolase II